MKKIALLLPALMLLVFACKKEKTTNTTGLSDFPLAVNNTWTYQVYDSIHQTSQTAVFKITGVYAINGGPLTYTTTTTTDGVVTDSGVITSSNDTIYYQPNGQGLFSNLTLLFPLSPNNYWHTQYYSDSVFVMATDLNLSVLNNNYSHVYQVGRFLSMPDLYINQNLYIAPHVGIIQQSISVGTWIPLNKSMKLVSYSLH